MVSLGKQSHVGWQGAVLKLREDCSKLESAITQIFGEMSANKFEVTIFNKTFKKYILTVHLERKRHNNLLTVGHSIGDKLPHTFLSALGQTPHS